MGEFSISHWAIILVIGLIFFGPSRLPGLGKSLGEAIRGFKKGLEEDEKSDSVEAQATKSEASENSGASTPPGAKS